MLMVASSASSAKSGSDSAAMANALLHLIDAEIAGAPCARRLMALHCPEPVPLPPPDSDVQALSEKICIALTLVVPEPQPILI